MTWVATAIIGSAIIGGVVSNSASQRAAKAATSASDQNIALQREIYDRNTANLSPFMERGNAAGQRINDLLGIGGDPTAARRGLDDWRDSTGYDFMFDEGMRGLNHTAAAAGGLQSGSAIKGGVRFGQRLGSTAFQDYINNLNNQQGGGITGASAIAGVGQGFANAVGANRTAAADAQGNAALTGASNVNSLLGNLAQTGAYAFGNSAYGSGGKTPSSSGDTTLSDAWSGLQDRYSLGNVNMPQFATLSDERLKTDVRVVGKTYDGQNIYTYRYRGGGPVQMGVMAQETEQQHPEAVTQGPDGYKRVDYGALSESPEERRRRMMLNDWPNGPPPNATYWGDDMGHWEQQADRAGQAFQDASSIYRGGPSVSIEDARARAAAAAARAEGIWRPGGREYYVLGRDPKTGYDDVRGFLRQQYARMAPNLGLDMMRGR